MTMSECEQANYANVKEKLLKKLKPAKFLSLDEGSRELTQQATNLHVRPPLNFCELRYTDVHKRVTDTKTKWRRLQSKMHVSR